jgi:hypothetical protein
MSEVIEIRLERLNADAFAPLGQLICARSDEPPIFEAPQHLRYLVYLLLPLRSRRSH